MVISQDNRHNYSGYRYYYSIIQMTVEWIFGTCDFHIALLFIPLTTLYRDIEIASPGI